MHDQRPYKANSSLFDKASMEFKKKSDRKHVVVVYTCLTGFVTPNLRKSYIENMGVHVEVLCKWYKLYWLKF